MRDEIATAKFDAIDAEIARYHIEQPLAKKIGLEPAGAAIGSDRCLVGNIERDVDVDILDAIRTGHELRDIAGTDGSIGAHIGADVDIGMTAQAKDQALARAGDLDIALRFARMIDGHEMLAPVLSPFDRTAAVARCEWNEKILGIELPARAEPAAHVVFDELDRAFRQAHLLGERAPVEEQYLRSAEHRELFTRPIPLCQQPTRLHGKRHV